MKLELKNVKINEAFSEETLMFKADLYVNGKKVAYANNDGRGGCTFYNAYSQELRPLLAQAEAYCITLPSKFVTYGEKTLEIKSTLEHWIDEVSCGISNKKEIEKHKKKLAKDMLKGICYSKNFNENGYKILHWKGYTLEQILNRNEGRTLVTKKIQELDNQGETILNTNLSQLCLRKDSFGKFIF
jgi:hypothetical protein